MRTTKNEFKQEVRSHIRNIMSEELGESLTEQMQSVSESFHNWYGPYEQKRTPNKRLAFREWMMGLPTGFGVEYTHHGQHETVKSWFENVGEVYKERDTEEESILYTHLLTREFESMAKLNGVKF